MHFLPVYNYHDLRQLDTLVRAEHGAHTYKQFDGPIGHSIFSVCTSRETRNLLLDWLDLNIGNERQQETVCYTLVISFGLQATNSHQGIQW